MNKDAALKILGLPANATRAEAKKAYRQLAKSCHPDRFPGQPGAAAGAEIRMKQLNAAFSCLVKVLPDPIQEPDPAQKTGKPPESDQNQSPNPNPAGPAPDPDSRTEAAKKRPAPGKGFFSAFARGLRTMAGSPKKTPSARAKPGRASHPKSGSQRGGRSGPGKKTPRTTVSFEDILRENRSGTGRVSKTARHRPASPAGDPYSRYVRLKQQLRQQRNRSRNSGEISRVEKITPVRPVPGPGDDSA